jgi:hypothetical protein
MARAPSPARAPQSSDAATRQLSTPSVAAEIAAPLCQNNADLQRQVTVLQILQVVRDAILNVGIITRFTAHLRHSGDSRFQKSSRFASTHASAVRRRNEGLTNFPTLLTPLPLQGERIKVRGCSGVTGMKSGEPSPRPLPCQGRGECRPTNVKKR